MPVIVLLVMAIQPGEVAGQPNPDPFDWRRFFPLEIGNIWEYEVLEGAPLVRAQIVGDTVVLNRSYYVLEEKTPLPGGNFIEKFYLRYDSAGVVVSLVDIEADSVNYPLELPVTDLRFPSMHNYLNLQASIGDTLFYNEEIIPGLFQVLPYGSDQLYISGELAETEEIKCYNFPCCWISCYAADIGWINGGSLQQYRLTYAKVNGKEIGTLRATAIETAEESPGDIFTVEAIFPNPFVDAATVQYELKETASLQIELFNSLGQRLFSDGLATQAAGRYEYTIQRSGLSSGVYYLRLTTNGNTYLHSIIVSSK